MISAKKNSLTTKELLLLQSELRNKGKSLALAYLMLLGGHLGIHRFYLNRHISGLFQLLLFLISTFWYILVVLMADVYWYFIFFFIIPVGVLTVWIIVDIFLMPKMVREWNEQLEKTSIQQIIDLRTNEE